MAIGTWVSQNKIRPGVYINYVFAEGDVVNYASDGVLATNYSLPLNPQGIIEITSSDVKNNNLKKYGVVSGTDSYKYITTLLSYCSKVYIYSPKIKDAVNASMTVSGEFSASAKFVGTEGNFLSVEVIDGDSDSKIFKTYYNSEVVAIQSLAKDSTDIEGDNEYITITIMSSTITNTVPVLLTNGTDGTVDMSAVTTEYFDKLYTYEVEVLAINFSEDEYDFSIVEDFINLYNEGHVQKLIAVYPKTNENNAGKNSEYVIAISPQTATLKNGLELTSGLLAGYIGARQAGADYKVDLTYTVLEDIVSISELTNEEIESNITNGIMNLSLRSDRSVVIENDINSLILIDADKSTALQSNDTIRLLNNLSYNIVSYGENSIIGKRKNNETTLNIVKAYIIGIMNGYVNDQVIQDFIADTDVLVEFGEQSEGILCTIALQKTNSAKKLYFSIGVR